MGGVAPCAGEQCCASEPLGTFAEVRHNCGFKEEIVPQIVKHSALEPKYEKTLAQCLATSPAGHSDVFLGSSVFQPPRGSPSPASRRNREVHGELEESPRSQEEREVTTLRLLLKRFVQETVRGQSYQVLVADGSAEPCKLLLAPNLQYFQLVTDGVIHDVPLKSIKDICPGRTIQTKHTPVDLDDHCATLVLRNNECVTFRLTCIRERDEFIRCVKVLALALD
ncbi:RAB23 [Symbiodinium natans]|uniref:RAB23 protein n=1 Tax=Symbiodinium natans TaxID=878477 RepID=A0A812UAW1_9DINO|nr:RAB23 [Symbiodinium natans]